MNMNHKTITIASLVSVSLLPIVALAKTIPELITDASNLIDTLIPLFMAVALLVFFVGLIQYVRAGESDDKKKTARGLIIYGVVILAVMASVWGLVNILTTTLGVQQGGTVTAPGLPT